MKMKQLLMIVAAVVVVIAASVGTAYFVVKNNSEDGEQAVVYENRVTDAVQSADGAANKPNDVTVPATQATVTENVTSAEAEVTEAVISNPDNNRPQNNVTVKPVNEMQMQKLHSDVTSAGNYDIIEDADGIKIVNAQNRKVIKAFSTEYKLQYVDGKTLYLSKAVYEPDVNVNPEFKYGSDGCVMKDWDKYFTSEFITYDISSGKTEALFRTNYFADICYVNVNYIYYLDIPESQKGFYNGFSTSYTDKNIVRFNRRTGEKKILAQDVTNVMSVTFDSRDYIVFKDEEFWLYLLNTANGKIYTIEKNAFFEDYRNGRVIYTVFPEEYLQGFIDRGTYPVQVMSCNIDGSDKQFVRELVRNTRIHIWYSGALPDKYILCDQYNGGEGGFELGFYDIETDEIKAMDCSSYDDFLLDDGLWVCYSVSDEDITTFYKINDNLECEELFDVNADVSKMEPKILTSYGFYYENDAGRLIFYQFPETIK